MYCKNGWTYNKSRLHWKSERPHIKGINSKNCVITNFIFVDDYPKFLRIVADNVFQKKKKIVKFFLWIILLLHVVITFVAIYFMVFVLKKSETVGYVAAFLGDFYVTFDQKVKRKHIFLFIIFIWLILNKPKLADVKKVLPLWKINTTSSKIYASIKRKTFLTPAFGLLNLLIKIIIMFI